MTIRQQRPDRPNGTDGTEDRPPGPPDGRRRRAGWKRLLDAALWVVVIGLVVWRFGPQVGAALGLGATDIPAPAFQVTTLAGDTLGTVQLEGRVVLVNFWATWCAPCRLEMPGFQDVWEDYADRGVTILGLSVDRGDRSRVRDWVRDKGITYPIAFPTGATVRAFGGANVLPTSILINRDGRIVHRVEGFYTEPALRAALNRLLD